MNIDLNAYIIYLYPFLVTLMVLEFFFARHLYDVKETLSGFAIALGATLVASFTKLVALAVFVVIFEFFKDFRLQYLGYESIGWAWWAWILCLLGDDFNFYWHHRFSHTVRLLWAAHVPHHNAHTFNLSVSIRNGWFITLYKPIFWLWMPLVGFEPVMIATCLVLNAIYQFFLHSQLVPRLGWYEKIFNTPKVHQVHHSCNLEYLDRNHGGILIIWDKLFGTFQDLDDKIKPQYGVLKGPDSYNPITANMHEFAAIWRDVKKAPTFTDKLKYIFYPPGWSHDNSTKTAKQMQQELAVTPDQQTVQKPIDVRQAS